MPNHGEKKADDDDGLFETFHFISSRVIRSTEAGTCPTCIDPQGEKESRENNRRVK